MIPEGPATPYLLSVNSCYFTGRNGLTYNSYINKKRAYTTIDATGKIVYSPPGAIVHQRCVHVVIVVAVLNEGAALKCPANPERYR